MAVVLIGKQYNLEKVTKKRVQKDHTGKELTRLMTKYLNVPFGRGISSLALSPKDRICWIQAKGTEISLVQSSDKRQMENSANSCSQCIRIYFEQ